jgi:hypothetical protein
MSCANSHSAGGARRSARASRGAMQMQGLAAGCDVGPDGGWTARGGGGRRHRLPPRGSWGGGGWPRKEAADHKKHTNSPSLCSTLTPLSHFRKTVLLLLRSKHSSPLAPVLFVALLRWCHSDTMSHRKFEREWRGWGVRRSRGLADCSLRGSWVCHGRSMVPQKPLGAPCSRRGPAARQEPLQQPSRWAAADSQSQAVGAAGVDECFTWSIWTLLGSTAAPGRASWSSSRPTRLLHLTSCPICCPVPLPACRP